MLSFFTQFILTMILFSRPIYAEFSKENHSIHQTADHLRSNTWELSRFHIAYGFTNQLMIVAWQFNIWANSSIDVRHQFKIKRLNISPEFSIFRREKTNENIYKLGIGGAMTLNSGKRNQHTYSFKLKQIPNTYLENQNSHEIRIQRNIQYDYYSISGNNFYLGARDLIPYLGYTWGFDNLYFGILLLPIVGWQFEAIPIFKSQNFLAVLFLPYFYLKF